MKKIRRIFDEVREMLPPVKETKDDEYLTACPICDVDDCHLSIKRDGDDVIMHCLKCDAGNEEIFKLLFPIDKEGQNTDEEIAKLREERKKLVEEKKAEHKRIKDKYNLKIVSEYKYNDINGNLVFKKQKFNYFDKVSGEVLLKRSGGVKKAFKIIDYKGISRIPKDKEGKNIVNLYNLDKLKNYSGDKPIFIVEGEKDCDTLANYSYLAISSFSGAGNNKRIAFTDNERKALLKHRSNLILIPDNDEAGEAYINAWKEFDPLVCRLKDIWPDAPKGADISDYLATGRDFKNVLDLVEKLVEKRFNDILPIRFSSDENDYEISERGIEMIEEDRRGNINRKTICKEPIYFDRCYYDEDKNELFYVINFLFRRKWEEIIVNSRLLKSNMKLIGLDGRLEINSNNAKSMVRFFEDYINYFRLKEDKCYTISDKLSIDDEGKFVGFGSKIKLNNEVLLKAFEPKGSRDKWFKAASDIWMNGSLIEVFEFCKLGISLCVNLMNDLTPIFELVGKTGIGKTVLMQNRISMYGNPAKGAGIFNSGNSTVKALDKLLEQVGYLPVEVDEGELLRNSRELRDDEGFNNFIYSLSEGISRSRLQKDKHTDDYQMNERKSWNTILNLTSESTLLRDTSGKGIINRVFTIEAEPEDLTLSLKYHNDLMTNYGWFIREIENRNIFNEETIKEFINNEKQFKEIDGYDEIASKQRNTFKYFAYTLMNFNKILGEREAYVEDFMDFFRKEEELDMTERYISDIYNLISQNQQRFFDRTDPELQLKTISTGNVWGVITEDYYYVDRNKLEEFFEKKYKISFKSIRKKLSDKNVIGVYTRKRNGKNYCYYDKVYSYKGFKSSCVRVSKDYLDATPIN